MKYLWHSNFVKGQLLRDNQLLKHLEVANWCGADICIINLKQMK